MRTIYLSPHLDDAILSAGGLIFEQTRAGIAVEIWSFMCGFPQKEELTDFATVMHKLWGTDGTRETIQIRREEDQQAAAIVGAHIVHFDFLDCIYRRGKDGNGLYADVFVRAHIEDADLPSRIAETILARLNPDDVVICPLAIGEHVDHVLVRQGAERAMLERARQHPVPMLRYFADIPYLLNHPEQLSLKTAGMKPLLQAISENAFEAWLEAIGAYESQLSTLFDSPDSMRERMREYWSRAKGLQFWQI
jgi:LmbE family N-acetylglucosaminyl deacetylase